jgi:cysteine-rich repeat protein
MAACRTGSRFAISLALLLSASVALAQGGSGGGGEEEGAGNNLSFPTVFAEGVGVTGLDATVDDGLRTPPETGDLFAGAYWLGWLDGSVQNVCDPATPDCPPAGATDVQRLYLQDDANNVWKAGTIVGTPGVPIAVDGVDWGDNLESGSWYENSVVRVETVLYKTVDPALGSYEMWLLYGESSPGEMQGARTSNAGAPVPLIIPSTEATVYSPCARLTIQKLRADAGVPVPADYAWNAATGAWDGAAYTMANSAVWESYTASEGSSGGYTAEVNVSGKLIDGYNWKLRDATLPGGVNKLGWYRLTFSLDGTGKCGGTSPIALNTSLATASIVVSTEETAAPLPRAGEPVGTSVPAVVDAANNLTYIDVYIGARRASCGDGQLDAGEQCDDGNLLDGDCCDQDCQLEPRGSACASDDDACTDDVCDGTGVCSHPVNTAPCDDGDACTANDTCAGGACVPGPAVTCADCLTCAPASGCTVPVADGTACNDGTACTTGDRCEAGTCVAGTPVVCPACEACDAQAGCTTAPPRDDCRLSQQTNGATLELQYRKRERNRLGWTWSAGDATSRTAFRLRANAAEPFYDLCIYDGDALLVRARTQAGSTCGKKGTKACWSENRKRVRYADQGGTPDGLVEMLLRDGAPGKARIRVKGVGPAFDPATLSGSGPFRVELRNRDNGLCWGASHGAMKRSRDRVRARGN